MWSSRNTVLILLGGLLWLYASGCVTTGAEKKQQQEFAEAPRPTPKLNAPTHYSYGQLLERQGNYEGAAAQLRSAIELRPDFIAAENRLGVVLNKLGRHAEATAVFRSATTRHPEIAYLHNNLGFSALLAGDYALAEAETRKAVELRPGFARARMNHAIALAKQGFFEASFTEFSHVGNGIDAYYNLAMVQADAGQYDKAVASLESALQLNPNLAPAKRELDRIALLYPRTEARPPADVAAAPPARAEIVADARTAMPEPAAAELAAGIETETSLSGTVAGEPQDQHASIETIDLGNTEVAATATPGSTGVDAKDFLAGLDVHSPLPAHLPTSDIEIDLRPVPVIATPNSEAPPVPFEDVVNQPWMLDALTLSDPASDGDVGGILDEAFVPQGMGSYVNMTSSDSIELIDSAMPVPFDSDCDEDQQTAVLGATATFDPRKEHLIDFAAFADMWKACPIATFHLADLFSAMSTERRTSMANK